MYVRTKKDIIYKAINVYHDYRNKTLYEVETGLERLILDEEEVSKEADTIEKLCDLFILIQYDGSHSFVNNTVPIDELLLGKRTLYGAIWTEKGLIYVAKMNDKGELELL